MQATNRDVVSDTEMTRSEEQMVVDTVLKPYARVRLRKVIVTREVTLTVTLRHEEFRIERLPVVDDDGIEIPVDPSLSEEGLIHEFVLHEEVPVVDLQVRPVERVRVDLIRGARQAELSADLRKERVDVVDPGRDHDQADRRDPG